MNSGAQSADVFTLNMNITQGIGPKIFPDNPPPTLCRKHKQVHVDAILKQKITIFGIIQQNRIKT